VDKARQWLEPVLERNLGQVAAPCGLWEKVVSRRPVPVRKKPVGWTLVPLLAGFSLVAAAVWFVVPRHSSDALTEQARAIRALSLEPDDLELRSDTVTEIRDWVKVKTGLDIPLPARTSDTVWLTGVCAVKGGTPAVEVAYRVNGRNAALLVSKVHAEGTHGEGGLPPDGRHRFLKCESVGGKRVSSWTMRGQQYTLAYAAHGDTRDECFLCHDGVQHLAISN